MSIDPSLDFGFWIADFGLTATPSSLATRHPPLATILSALVTRHSPLPAGLKLASFFRLDFSLVGLKSQHVND